MRVDRLCAHLTQQMQPGAGKSAQAALARVPRSGRTDLEPLEAAQVDQKIDDIAQRKLALDAAVLTGLGAAEERKLAASILQDILNDHAQS